MSRPIWSQTQGRWIGDGTEHLDPHLTYKDRDDRYWSFYDNDNGGDWELLTAERELCECGGAKTAKTHSTWCPVWSSK
jgi:hypothetical protein